MADKIQEVVAQELVRQLYPDIKNMLVSACKKMVTPVRKSTARRYKSTYEVLEDLKGNKIKNNTFISLECRPSLFGPFLRKHLLPILYGANSQMRLGPPILCEDPALQMIAQTTSHLKPVGLYPKIDNEVSQICLYPSDATCCGMVGLLPEVNSIITTMPAIASQEKLAHCDSPSIVIGIVRMITRSMFEEKNIPIDVYEDYRKSGNIWFLDVFSEGTEIKPMFDGIVTELWGGLYASGHIEFEGTLNATRLYERIIESFKVCDLTPDYMQNKVAGEDVCIASQGFRFFILPKLGMYSIHMDADLALDYKKSREKFDKICDSVLLNINDSVHEENIELKNPFDLDFSYIDSVKTFSILQSEQAEKITDPLAISIRNWHRLKNK